MLKSVLNNKRVILIGQSSYIVDFPCYQSQGEFIDSFDIAIQINDGYPKLKRKFINYISNTHFVHPKFQSVLGSKRSIVYSYHNRIPYITQRITSFKRNGGGHLWIVRTFDTRI